MRGLRLPGAWELAVAQSDKNDLMAQAVGHLPQVIHVDKDKCVHCHACIAACPVKICNDVSGSCATVDADTCIACGRCLTACTHGARYLSDDFPQLVEDLRRGQPTIALVAPSAAASFPERHLRLNGWLCTLGIEAVFDVTLGAELCAKSYAALLRGSAPRLIIAQPCAAVVTYIEVHRPELLPYLAPVDSPMVHTMKAIRRRFPQYRQHRIAVISPCPAKNREFAETGWGDYNVTFQSIWEYQQSRGLNLDRFPEVEFATPSPAGASLLPTPGGLLQAIERHCPGIGRHTRTIQGQDLVYRYLATLPDTLSRNPQSAPLLIDCLNCEHGCSCGPASLNRAQAVDAVEHWIQKRHQDLQSQEGRLKTDRFLQQCWEEGAFARTYASLPAPGIRRPSGDQREAILRSMHKYSERDIFNCCSCGYGSCDEMVLAIHNGLNRPENCHHYLAKETEVAGRQLAEYRDHLENLVQARTAELTRANQRLQAEIRNRMRVENALQDSRQELRDIVQGSPIPQFVIDKNHRVIYWNKALEEFSQIKAEQVLGSNEHWKAFYAEERPCLADLLLAGDVPAIGRFYEGGFQKSPILVDAYEATAFLPNLGAQGKWVDFAAAVIRDSKGAIVGAVETIEDITSRRQTEIELARSQQAAEAANRAKSEFLANMSHEIRTPMTAILGYADILADALDDPRLLDAVNTIRSNGDQLLEIINGILDLSKIEAGKLQIERIQCSLRIALANVVALMQVRAAQKGLALAVEYAGPCPETIVTDPTALRQILINLLSNAIKFTKAGEVRIVVGLQDRDTPQPRLTVAVVDTGIGMTAQQIAGLFQPFQQADASTTREFGGTGLGLAICKRLADMLDGELSVRSEPGRGSTFTLSIDPGPLSGVAMLDRPGAPLSPKAKDPGDQSREARPVPLKCRVLVAEDGPDNRRLINYLLKTAGAEVTAVENGLLAVETALGAREAGQPFDVILMDMQMPVLDGYGAVKRLRRQGYDGPILALTAHAMVDDHQKCLDAGCDDYATKPIDRQQFLAMVTRWAAPSPSLCDAPPLASPSSRFSASRSSRSDG